MRTTLQPVPRTPHQPTTTTMNEIRHDNRLQHYPLTKNHHHTPPIDFPLERKHATAGLLRHMIILEEDLLNNQINIEAAAVDAYFLGQMYRLVQTPSARPNQVIAINDWLSDLDWTVQQNLSAAKAAAAHLQQQQRDYEDFDEQEKNEIPEELDFEEPETAFTGASPPPSPPSPLTPPPLTPTTPPITLSHEPVDVLAMLHNISQKASQENIERSDINQWLDVASIDASLPIVVVSPVKLPAKKEVVNKPTTLVMRKIKKYIDKAKIKVMTIFRQFDTSGDGMLSSIEFRKGIEAVLSNAPFDISKQDINAVFIAIAVDHSISYRQFLAELRDADPARQASLAMKQKKEPTLDEKQQQARTTKTEQLNQQKKLKNTLHSLDSDEEENGPLDPLDAVSKKARQFLKKNTQKAINLFRDMDTDGNGVIDQEELREGMKILGLKLTPFEFSGLWYGLDKDGSGECDMKELEEAIRDSDPERKKALAFYSRPPKLIPRNSISRAFANRNRRQPGSLSWILCKTPKTFIKAGNPAYPGKIPTWKEAGTISKNFPTAFRPVASLLPIITSPVKHVRTSPLRRKKEKMTESGARRHRNDRYLKKTKNINLRHQHMASVEEKILCCIIMREGYIYEMKRLFQNAKPKTYFHKKKHPFLDYNKTRKTKKKKKQVKKKKDTAHKTYMHINQLRPAVAHLIEDLQRMSCETVEHIEEWALERTRLRAKSALKNAHVNNKGTPPLHKISPPASTPCSFSEPFLWQGQNYIAKMARDLDFLFEHREVIVESLKRHFKQRASRNQAMELDKSKRPFESVSTQTMLNLTRRSEDFAAFFSKHDKSGDGKLQRHEFETVLQDMELKLDQQQVSELYVVLDRDGDGEIDTKELLRAITDTQRATETAWVRFEMAEQIVLNNLSKSLSSKSLNLNTSTRSAQSNRTYRSDATNETTPDNTDGHSELYRVLLHGRAEFELSFPALNNHYNAAADDVLLSDYSDDEYSDYTSSGESYSDSYDDDEASDGYYDDDNDFE